MIINDVFSQLYLNVALFRYSLLKHVLSHVGQSFQTLPDVQLIILKAIAWVTY